MVQNTPSDTCIGVSQNSFDSLSTLATAILGPGVILTTNTLSPSPTQPPPLTSFPSNTTTSASTTAGLQQAGKSNNSVHHLGTPALVGTIVGVILSMASISISGCAFYIRFAQKRKRSSLSDDGLLEGD
ncbi:hypothetical protein L207DRAFT_22821 [Hyaloscypha variabilis F]|uniref:Uncharacterized protein n=1 Tax=Hyaloscypha variabilis (strain UAMH 11265 / GT02V1 / F) TaxID=1149755 RepID=A0A2J6RLW8_HYAVF|nr:hypothetical protein L207DRAFT_22821 [Hyaloscypha variabilis F]